MAEKDAGLCEAGFKAALRLVFKEALWNTTPYRLLKEANEARLHREI